MSASDAKPAPAATLIIARNAEKGAGVEVLMVERRRDLAFGGGALAFPGGRLEEVDRAGDLHNRCLYLGAADPEQLSFKLAAIREAFEETGLLFAFDNDGWSIGEKRRAAFAEKYRNALEAGDCSFAGFARREGLLFAPRDLLHFAHWITPAKSAKRFDTHFYLALAPEGQKAAPCGGEAVGLAWITPGAALEEAAESGARLMLPTRLNLELLATSENAYEALKLAARRPVVPVEPEIFERDGEQWARIPEAAGYGRTEVRRLGAEPELGGGG